MTGTTPSGRIAAHSDQVGKRLAYPGRLFGFLGPPETAAELFARLVPETIDAFLADSSATALGSLPTTCSSTPGANP